METRPEIKGSGGREQGSKGSKGEERKAGSGSIVTNAHLWKKRKVVFVNLGKVDSTSPLWIFFAVEKDFGEDRVLDTKAMQFVSAENYRVALLECLVKNKLMKNDLVSAKLLMISPPLIEPPCKSPMIMQHAKQESE